MPTSFRILYKAFQLRSKILYFCRDFSNLKPEDVRENNRLVSSVSFHYTFERHDCTDRIGIRNYLYTLRRKKMDISSGVMILILICRHYLGVRSV